MPQYLFQLGHQPHISVAELFTTIDDLTIEKQIEGWLFASTKKTLDQAWLNKLGSTVLVAQYVQRSAKLMHDIPAVLTNQEIDGRVTFTLRMNEPNAELQKELTFHTKKVLKRAEKSVRYMGDGTKAVALSALQASDITELLLFKESDSYWIGKTVAAQDTADYTKRDIEKPIRDTVVGLLPPKLSQTMLNLALWARYGTDVPNDVTIYDPFCGTGVIPMEVLLRGFNIIGSDLSPKAVADTPVNLAWFCKEYNLDEALILDVFKKDATTKWRFEHHVDVIVTETMLGTPLTQAPAPDQLTKLMKHNENLQINWLKQARKQCPC